MMDSETFDTIVRELKSGADKLVDRIKPRVNNDPIMAIQVMMALHQIWFDKTTYAIKATIPSNTLVICKELGLALILESGIVSCVQKADEFGHPIGEGNTWVCATNIQLIDGRYLDPINNQTKEGA